MQNGFAHRADRLAALATPAMLTLALVGCAVPWPSPQDAANDAPSQVMHDLVAAYAQIEPPMHTTLQIGTSLADARPALVDALLERGYGLQRVTGDEGARLVGWSWRPALDGAEASTQALLTIGVHALQRRYSMSPNGIRPVSPLLIGGTRAPVTLDDSRFADLPPQVSSVRYQLTPNDETIELPLISLVTDEVIEGVARRASSGAVPSADTPDRRGINGSRIEISNRYFGDSAFSGLRASMQQVHREIIVFPNDSMRLGEDGKRQIATFIDRYRQASDMIGLIGCSNGPTVLSIGNEGLALGRSRRVSDELVSLGVDRTRVIDEGCWSGDTGQSRFPGRGVVLELLRRKR